MFTVYFSHGQQVYIVVDTFLYSYALPIDYIISYLSTQVFALVAIWVKLKVVIVTNTRVATRLHPATSTNDFCSKSVTLCLDA